MTFAHRRLAMLLLMGAVACGGRPRTPVAPAPAQPELTVAQFLDAANAGDLDRMARYWGDERGPSDVSNVIPRPERQRRLTVMQRLLSNDSYRVVATDATRSDRRVLQVEMNRGPRRFTVPFTLVEARTGGWLIREIGLEAAMPAAGPRPGS